MGERISWTLRSPISKHINLVRLENGQEFDVPEGKDLPKVGDEANGSKVVEVVTWEERRANMKQICRACHTNSTVDGHYKQFDDVVDLYNEKFATPIAAIMGELKQNGYITPTPFDEPIEWTWWEIWHHEGRRARHGASMSGPDYTWWNGIYEVAKNTYFEFIPQLKEVVIEKDGNDEFAVTMLETYFKPIDGHNWYFEGMSTEQHRQGPQGLRGSLREGRAQVGPALPGWVRHGGRYPLQDLRPPCRLSQAPNQTFKPFRTGRYHGADHQNADPDFQGWAGRHRDPAAPQPED